MNTIPPAILTVANVSKIVGKGANQLTILRDINLTINRGESIAILGASGSGKTTLLTLLAGLDLPTSGNIYFQNHQITTLNEEQRALMRGKSIGFIFQNFELLPTLTTLDNVMLPLEIRYIKQKIARQQAEEWLTRVGLGKRLYHYPYQLSGGEQQRVAIARAFVTNPTIIFADELTGNLDEKTGELIIEILFTLNQIQQVTLVLVTHDNQLANHCQRRLLLQDGILKT